MFSDDQKRSVQFLLDYINANTEVNNLITKNLNGEYVRLLHQPDLEGENKFIEEVKKTFDRIREAKRNP